MKVAGRWKPDSLQSTAASLTPASSEEEGLSGGHEVGVPSSWDGGSRPATPPNDAEGFLRRMQQNVAQLVQEELAQVDATTAEQAWCLPVLSEVLVKKLNMENEVHQKQVEKEEATNQAMENQFLVTKTVSNKEV